MRLNARAHACVYVCECLSTRQLLYVAQLRGTPLIGPLLTVPCDDGVASGLVTDTPTGACSATINNLDSSLRFTVQVIANSCAGSGPPSAATQPQRVSETDSICRFPGDIFDFSPPPPPPPRPPGPVQPPPPAPPFQCGNCVPGTVILEECIPPPAPVEAPTTSLGPSGTACLSFNISYPFPDGPTGPIDDGFLNVTGVTVLIRPFGSPADTVKIDADVPPGDAESSVILDTDEATGNLLGLISIGGLDDGVPYNFVYALDNCAAQSGFSPSTDFLVPLPAQDEPTCPNPFQPV